MEPTPSQELWGTHRKSSAMVVPAPRSTIKSTIPVRNAPFQPITLAGQWYTTFLTYLWITTAVIFHPTQRTTSNNTGPKAKFRAESLPSPWRMFWGPPLAPASFSFPSQSHYLKPGPQPHTSLPPHPHGAAQQLNAWRGTSGREAGSQALLCDGHLLHLTKSRLSAEAAGSREHGFLQRTNLAPLHSAAFSQLYALANSASDCSSRIFPHKFCHSICILKSTTCTK